MLREYEKIAHFRAIKFHFTCIIWSTVIRITSQVIIFSYQLCFRKTLSCSLFHFLVLKAESWADACVAAAKYTKTPRSGESTPCGEESWHDSKLSSELTGISCENRATSHSLQLLQKISKMLRNKRRIKFQNRYGKSTHEILKLYLTDRTLLAEITKYTACVCVCVQKTLFSRQTV